MVGNSGGVVIRNGQAASYVLKVADEWGVENKRLRAYQIAGGAFGKGGYFVGGKGCCPDANFSYKSVKKKTSGTT